MRSGTPTRRAVAALTVLAGIPALASPGGASAAASSCPSVGGAAAVPSAAQVLGRPLAAGPTSPEETDRYLLALDAASPRIRTAIAGRSREGRPLRYAVVGDPRAIRRSTLERRVERLRAVRAGHGGAATVRRAAGGPALAWVGGGVHANETSGPPALLDLLARLAAGTDCATRRTLHDVVAVVQPDQNPDGHAAGTRTNAAGFDLNRDWFAATQPETAARIALLRRFPPVLALDVHEQGGSGYFAPPYAEPVLDGLPPATRALADGPVSRAMSAALRPVGVVVEHRSYDLLYPGYADSATSLAFGAGGTTLEQGSDPPLATRIARHRLAVAAALDALARRRAAAVRGWAAGFRDAVADGRRGRTDGGGTAYGWYLPAGEPDALALAGTLRAAGARVRALRRARTLRGVDPVGPAGARRTRLPAGTLVVPAEQPLRRWLEVLLERDAGEGGRGGEDTWSLPRLTSLEAGTLRAPLPPADALGPVPTRAAGAVAPSGVRVTATADESPALTGPPTGLAAGERPSGWLLDGVRRLGPTPEVRSAASLAGGVPAGTTHLLVGPGRTTGLPAARTAIEAFLRTGGTLVLLGDEGIGAAAAAGLTSVSPTPAPARDAVAIRADASGPLASLGAPWVVVAGEPRIVAPAGATVPLRARSGDALAPSGAPGVADGLGGRPLVVDEPRDGGHVVSVAFSPVFRGQSAGGLRILAALLGVPR